MTSHLDPRDTCLRVETITRESAAWVIIHGEADLANLEHLEDALARVELNDAKWVHLHVSDLDFIDVATLSRLTAFAQWVRQTGRDIATCGARPMLQKMARILGYQTDLGLS